MFLLLTSKKGLQFLFEWQPSIPKFVHADENKLRQIMINLLGNAVKFTAAGGIGARFRADKAVDAAGAASERLLLPGEAEDTGPGMSKEEQARGKPRRKRVLCKLT